MRHILIRAGLMVSLCAACGPGAPSDDGTAPPEPEWAYGWWMTTSGLQDHLEWGAYILQMEIRPDGTVFQTADYCNGDDWVYESRWELQADGSIRILPKDGDDGLPFQHFFSPEYLYVDIKQTANTCEIAAMRVIEESQSEVTLERGRWCIGDYLPEFNECEMELYCGEDPPVCD
jgi:hypothetical protein